MEEQINNVIEWLKLQDIKGCITGSCLLGYFEGQDIDCFVYDKSSFIALFYALKYNKSFLILDKLEQWKANQFAKDVDNVCKKSGILTIKYVYNTCVTLNIVLKRDCSNIFDVLSSFDMDIVCKGYDIETKLTHDYTYGSTETKIASWNKLNTKFYNPTIWDMSNILRQFGRVFKYHNREYNTDALAIKYIEIIDQIQEIEDIFSEQFSERLKLKKENTKIVKKMLQLWLETHEITEEEIQIMYKKINE